MVVAPPEEQSDWLSVTIRLYVPSFKPTGLSSSPSAPLPFPLLVPGFAVTMDLGLPILSQAYVKVRGPGAEVPSVMLTEISPSKKAKLQEVLLTGVSVTVGNTRL